MMALQGTEPIFVQAKEMIENAPRDVDFSKPEALTEEEVGMDTNVNKLRIVPTTSL